MKTIDKQSGFSTIELLITLIIAVGFFVSGYQLYNMIIKDGGETRLQARASNIAYDYLQRYKPDGTSACAVSTPMNNQAVSFTDLADVYITVNITCPSGATVNVAKVQVTVKYGNPQEMITTATYVTTAP